MATGARNMKLLAHHTLDGFGNCGKARRSSARAFGGASCG